MHADQPPGPLRTWLSTLPALLVLLVSVAQGTSEIVQARMLALGEQTWPGYAELRKDAPPPTCDPETIGTQAGAAPKDDDDALLDDLFDAPAPAGAAAPDAPAAAPDDDDALLDDLVGGGGGPSEAAVAAAKERCVGEHERHAELQSRITPTLRAFRGVDLALTKVTDFGRRSAQPSLVLLIVVCAATASALRAHIALRPVVTRRDNVASEAVQLAVALLAGGAFLARYRIVTNAGIDAHMPWIALVWAAGFGVMALIHVRALVWPREDLEPGGSPLRALLTVPLYAVMGLIGSVWFLLFEHHPSGLAIFLDKITEHAGIYLQVGLFVWAGMLLKRTALPHRSFDVLRPLRLPPELLAAVVVLVAALPTAYSGASGIFVIAAGAIIYEELRRAGARNQLALAATAMSGSMGVVLSPCLLVVIVAALNKQLTTGELFAKGYLVFGLTAVLFVLALVVTRRNPLTIAPLGEAGPQVLAALRPLLPYAVILVGTLAFYATALGAWLDEHSAARIVLVILLLFVLFEGRRLSPDGTSGPARIAGSTNETTIHIGALLVLMAFSVGFGGVVERAEVMSAVPAELGSTWLTMAVLTAMLVVIGMLMDPYGAVILVSATIAHVAYGNGIDPLHFWMVVLVAFELGYLTPPVALNHLLTRLVVGPDGDTDDLPADATFWERHERYLLPVSVMGTALILVAFVPLAFMEPHQEEAFEVEDAAPVAPEEAPRRPEPIGRADP